MQVSQGLVQTRHATRRLIVASRAMEHVCQLVRKYALHDATVLVTGESGVGKELIARMVHDQSPYGTGPFVPVNCASIPESLFDSEMSGFVRGAFTGADRDRKGLFENAAGGTLFLDEVGELPMACQPKLLRILQEGAVRPVGAHTERPVHVRTVVATNKDLAECVKKGTFRGDLYHRINVLPINVPPLRERREEIPILAEHFAVKRGKTFTPKALEALYSMSWDGNVRELEHVIERTLILAEKDTVDVTDIDACSFHGSESRQGIPVAEMSQEDLFTSLAGRMLKLRDVEDGYIRALCELTGLSGRKVADILDISTSTLIRRLRDRKE